MAVRRKKKTSARTSGTRSFNRNAQWKAYRELQMQADRAWEKFHEDVRRNAKSDVMIRDNNHLLLLLGECNYMARECMRMASKGKKKGR